MSVKDILVKAKSELTERGVNRNGQYLNESTGCLCAFGAVFVGAGAEVVLDGERYTFRFGGYDSQAADLADEELREALEEMGVGYNGYNNMVTSFNDNSKEDQEVLDLFDRAIARVS